MHIPFLFELFKGVSRVLCFVGMSFIPGIMFLTTLDVISRSVLGKPIPGSFELSEYMLCIVTLLGLAYTERARGHIRVEVLIKRLKRARKLQGFLSAIIGLFVVVILVTYGWKDATAERGVSEALRIPRYPFRFLVCLGSFAFGIELVFGLLRLRKKDPQ